MELSASAPDVVNSRFVSSIRTMSGKQLQNIAQTTGAENTLRMMPVASERWNVEKRRLALDTAIDTFHRSQVARCMHIDQAANEKATKIYNEVVYKSKWMSPPFPLPHRKLIIEFCKHTLLEGSLAPFQKAPELKIWNGKAVGSFHEKNASDLEKMANKLWDVVHKRDMDIQRVQSEILLTTEKLNIKKDGELRWMMHGNAGRKDEVFSIWYLAAHNKIRELDVLLHSTTKRQQYSELGINEPDPDFGMTPLHYACRTVKVAMVLYLLGHGADVLARAADGRTALHFAAQYSCKEIIVELLGAGAEFDALDNYGCSALQLAEQNKNIATTLALKRWASLVPHNEIEMELSIERESFLSLNDQDYNAFPPEFRPTPADSFDRMSATLRLLTKRLDAYNIYLKHPVTDTGSLERLAHSTGGKPYYNNNPDTMMLSYSPLRATNPATAAIVQTAAANQDINSSSNSSSNGSRSSRRSADAADGNNGYHNGNSVISSNISNSNNSSNYEDLGAKHSNTQLPPGVSAEINECLVEIRLLTKHYSACVKEDIEVEAMRSLQRRWTVAQRLWGFVIQQQEQKAEQRRIQQEQQFSMHQDSVELARAAEDSQHYADAPTAGAPNGAAPTTDAPTAGPAAAPTADTPTVATPTVATPTADAPTTADAASGAGFQSNETEHATEDTPAAPVAAPLTATPVDLEQLALSFNRKIQAAAEAAAAAEQAKLAAADTSYNPVATHTSLLNEAAWKEFGPIAEARLAREREYDAIGLDVYKVTDKIFYEKESADAESQAPTGLMPSLTHTSMPHTDAATASLSAGDTQETSTNNQASGGASVEVEVQSSSAPAPKKLTPIEVILKWQAISKERAERQPYFDTYYAGVSDELVSASSSLTATYNPDDAGTTSSVLPAAAARAEKGRSNSSSSSSSSISGPTAHKLGEVDSLAFSQSLQSQSLLSPSQSLQSQQHFDRITQSHYKAEISGSYVAKLGMELCHVLVARKEEGQALPVLEECLRIKDNIEDTLRIAMLAQKCELLLHIHDQIVPRDPPFSDQVQQLMLSVLNTYPDQRRAKIIDNVIDRWRTFLAERRRRARETAQALYGTDLDDDDGDDDTTDLGLPLSRIMQPASGVNTADSAAEGRSVGTNSYNGSTIESVGESTAIYTTALTATTTTANTDADRAAHATAATTASATAATANAESGGIEPDSAESSNTASNIGANDGNDGDDDPVVLTVHSTAVGSDGCSGQNNYNLTNVSHVDNNTQDKFTLTDTGVWNGSNDHYDNHNNNHNHYDNHNSFAQQQAPPELELDLEVEFATLESRKEQLQKALIIQCLLAANESLAVHRHVFHSGRGVISRIGDGIDNVVEPPSVATVLLHKARAAELVGRHKEAFDCLLEAEAVAVRSAGPTCEFTINIMLESLRLYVKVQLPHTLQSGLQYVNNRGTEINQAITAFSLSAEDEANNNNNNNNNTLAICDALLKRCSELLALSTLAVHAASEQSKQQAAAEAAEQQLQLERDKHQQRRMKREQQKQQDKIKQMQQRKVEQQRARQARDK